MRYRDGARLGFALAATSMIAAGVALLTPRTAWAMAAPPCPPLKLLPTASSVPANLPAFGFNAVSPNASAKLYSVSGGQRTELPVTLAPAVDGFVKVTPNSALVAGTSYELEYTGASCLNGYGNPPAGPYEFSAVASAPIPSKVGTLQGTPVVETKNLGTTRFTIDATYAIDAEMKPWAAVYELLLVVDGRIVSTKTTLSGTETAKLVATGWCDATNAAANPHQMQLRARLPFSPNIESASAAVAFDCPAPALKTPGGAPPSGTSTTAPTGTTPSGSSGSTAPGDGGTSAAPGSSSSSSCRSSPGSTTTLPLIVLGMLAAGLTRRRRRS